MDRAVLGYVEIRIVVVKFDHAHLVIAMDRNRAAHFPIHHVLTAKHPSQGRHVTPAPPEMLRPRPHSLQRTLEQHTPHIVARVERNMLPLAAERRQQDRLGPPLGLRQARCPTLKMSRVG